MKLLRKALLCGALSISIGGISLAIPKNSAQNATKNEITAFNSIYFGKNTENDNLEFYAKSSPKQFSKSHKVSYEITLIETWLVVGQPPIIREHILSSRTYTPTMIINSNIHESFDISSYTGPSNPFSWEVEFSYSLSQNDIILQSETQIVANFYSFSKFCSSYTENDSIISSHEIVYFDGESLVSTFQTSKVLFFDILANNLNTLGLDFRKLAYDPIFRYETSLDARITFRDIHNLFPKLSRKGNVSIPLSFVLDSSINAYKCQFKNEMYVDTETGEVSRTLEGNFRNKIDYLVFPYREERIRDYVFELIFRPSLSQCEVTFEIPMTDAVKKGIGTCYLDEYCMQTRFTSQDYDYFEVYEANYD